VFALQPQTLTSSPQLLEQFVDRCLEKGIRGEDLPFDGMLSTGAKLSSDRKAKIENFLESKKLLNAYVCTEFGYLGSECELGHFHLNTHETFYEVTDGSLIVSSVRNLAMPLIRYKLGDRVKVLGQPCECGRKGFVLEYLEGRSYPEFIVEGRRISPSIYMHLFHDFTELQEYQLSQVSLRVFTLKVESKNGDSSFPMHRFLEAVSKPLGSEIEIKWEFTSGLGGDKFQRFRSELLSES
jgi:phenylacetate-CoA ligase